MTTNKEIEKRFSVEIFGSFSPAESETLHRLLSANRLLGDAVKQIQAEKVLVSTYESAVLTAREKYNKLTAEGLLSEANTAASTIPSIRKKIDETKTRITKVGAQIRTLNIAFDSVDFQRQIYAKMAELDRMRKRGCVLSMTATDAGNQAASILRTIAETVD
jgi:uncharacterized coiled-coil DUF342 family protein